MAEKNYNRKGRMHEHYEEKGLEIGRNLYFETLYRNSYLFSVNGKTLNEERVDMQCDIRYTFYV